MATMIVRAASGAAYGLVLGCSLTVITVVAVLALSFLTGSAVGVPYVIAASYAEADGLPELSFTLDPDGVLGVVAATAIGAMAYWAAAGRPGGLQAISRACSGRTPGPIA
ncbi:hypothetical protein [Nocardiopsis baichengensis]|uniref:hypothetical protein n=1 Tax=Nocardiopsis baichengensis TaxID=280240 RepID=UPI00034D192A|nr:hypothetical protein [Nocardiopsis baichengensis]